MMRPRHFRARWRALRIRLANLSSIEAQLYTRALPLFMVLLLSSGVVIAGLGALFYHSTIFKFCQGIARSEHSHVRFTKEVLDDLLYSVISDVQILASQQELQHLLDHDAAQQAVDDMAEEYLAVSAFKGVYDQIRFLDLEGQERVRVNFNAGTPSVVPAGQLQNKAKRYYFTDTLHLSQGEIFISPFDLNIEHGVLERPLKPMIRIGTPVFDDLGRKRGIVLVNYLGQAVIERLMTLGAQPDSELMLVNADGFWLLGTRPEDEWGFMIPERAERRFGHDYPEIWSLMQHSEQGQWRTREGLFTVARIFPLTDGVRSSSGALDAYLPSATQLGARDYYWFLVTRVPVNQIDHYAHQVLTRLLLLCVGIWLLTATTSWYLSLTLARRRQDQARLRKLAHFDTLTRLPNRALFFDRLNQVHANAKRYKRRYGLIYFDLDGFKAVNDTLGHQAGDELLKHVADTLSTHVRQADSVARLGGDEFAVILSVIKPDDVGSIQALGDKLIAQVRQIDLHTLSQTGPSDLHLRIGASAGVALYPDHAHDPRTLIHKADEAMYRAKRAGKNQCIVAH